MCSTGRQEGPAVVSHTSVQDKSFNKSKYLKESIKQTKYYGYHDEKRKSNSWVKDIKQLIDADSFLLSFFPGLLQGPVPAVFTIRTKMSALSTMIWSLPRAAAWLKSRLKSLIHRCSTNPCVLSYKVSVHKLFTICLLHVSICYMFVPVSVHTVILNSSGIQFCIVGCSVICVSSCFWPLGRGQKI